MPELPEVTTFIAKIVEHVLNKKIIRVNVYNDKLIKNSTKQEFINFFLDESFIRINRKGKFIIFFLTNNKSFVLHLRMEGKIIFHKHNDPLLNNHNLVTWYFANDEELRYYDTRMFGTMEIYYGNPFELCPSLKKLGKEPFDDDFNWEYIKNGFLAHKKTMLKPLLLDQSIIAGIGNIYADEILFACKLNPTAFPTSLTDEDYKNIAYYTKEILLKAIKAKGTTVSSYGFDRSFHKGNYQKYLQVHTRENLPCYSCGTMIKKTTVNGRGTYYCPNCQSEIVETKQKRRMKKDKE